MKLTDTKIKALKPRDKRYQVSDGHGLAIEVFPAGTKAWLYRYRFGGKEQAVRLGQYPVVTLSDARARRLEQSRLLEKGLSPAADKQQRKLAHVANPLFKDFADRYVREVAMKRRKDHTQIRRWIDKDVVPHIGKLHLQDIKSTHIAEVLDRILKRGAPQSALAVRNLLVRIFAHAVGWEILEKNPASKIKADVIAVPKARERAMTSDEIRVYLTTIYKSSIARRYKLAFHLLLITMARKSELVFARWTDIDFDAATWCVPKELNKIGKPKVIYLSTQAANLFRELKELSDGSDLVFPGRNKPTQSICKTSLNSTLAGLKFDIPAFTIHDSRRTASTLLNEMGWNSDVIEKALGHEVGGVRGVYNRAQYADQRRELLQHWADFVDSIMNERKVIQGNFGRAA